MFERALAASRFLVILATVSLLLGAVVLLSYGAVVTIDAIIQVVRMGVVDAKMEKALVIELIGLVDLFLLAIVLLIIASGVYQLFVSQIKMPPALTVRSLSELKEKLVSVIIVVLAVIFLGEVGEKSLQSTGQINLIELGIGASVVMIALTVFILIQAVSGRIEHAGSLLVRYDSAPSHADDAHGAAAHPAMPSSSTEKVDSPQPPVERPAAASHLQSARPATERSPITG